MHYLYFHLIRLFRHKFQANVVKKYMEHHRISVQVVNDSSIHLIYGLNKKLVL